MTKHDERNRRARELLESSGTVLFFREKQLLKENRFHEIGQILERRMRRVRLFMVICTVLATAMIVATRLLDPNPSWLDYGPAIGLLLIIASTEFGNRRVRRTLEEVDAVLDGTGSTDAQALS